MKTVLLLLTLGFSVNAHPVTSDTVLPENAYFGGSGGGSEPDDNPSKEKEN
ncbi:MAG: hypothetical protein OQJ95_00995 [Kangiella sp.]|nr:hypothetical protein [Kangiella sp.]MCW9029658.1 hypothetical protein [Kangiella sp.]